MAEQTCEECGRPLSICNAMAMIDQAIKRKKHTLDEILKAIEEDKIKRKWEAK